MMRIFARPPRPGGPRGGAMPRSRHPLVTVVGAVALATVAAACGNTTNPAGGTLVDNVPPKVSVLPQAAPNDSSIAFTVQASDNLGLLNVHVTLSGPGISGSIDTTFTSAVTSVTLPYVINVPPSVPPGTNVTVIASAMDGAHNLARPDTAIVATGTAGATLAIITSPKATDTAVVGFSLAVSLTGVSPNMVRALGYIASGVFPSPVADSVLFNSPLKDSVSVDTSLSLVGASAGTMTLTPFVMDSLGRRVLGASVQLVVSSSAGGNTVPTVTFGVTPRIEVRDTVHVEAHDRAGVKWMGYEVRSLPSDPQSFFAADSFQISGNVSSAVHRFNMNLNISTFPKNVTVMAFATNNTGHRAYALLSDGVTPMADTVSVVAGLTKQLPDGGTIADALYHPGTNRLYMSNIDKNELEVFDLSDSSFAAPIIVGSQPWGIAAWPLNTSGAMGDTLLVANSGGTLISYVNIAGNADQEVYRYPLPNIIAYTVTTTTSSAGVPIQQLTPYDFSDRPQYLAATCRASGGVCGDVVLVYSTTPTPGQSLPFPKMGTVRWEDLTAHSSHFFFEQALGQTQGRADTLKIDRFASQGVGSDSVLVPYQENGVSEVVRIDQLGFRDTTFVRNSGNFQRAIIGEGGPVLGSRAIMYDVSKGFNTADTALDGTVVTLTTPLVDRGVSSPTDVSDFIANTFSRVGGVAINFDGALAAIRGDSTYIIDDNLRLQGLMATSGGNPGFDFHPQNAGIGPSTSPIGTRLSFAASTSPQIEVYDTYTFRRCLIVPTRDPIIGPIKAALRSGSTDIVLVGATASGVVIVTIPQSQLASCQ